MESKGRELLQNYSSTFSLRLWTNLQRLVEGQGASPEDLAQLTTMGITDSSGAIVPVWKNAISAVESSPVEMLIILGVLENFSMLRYHLSSAEGEHHFISAIADADKNRRITFPFMWEDLLEYINTAINLYGPSKSHAMELELDFDEFSAMIGYIDALRTQSIQALMERRDITHSPVSRNEIIDMALKGADSKDNRWLVSSIGKMAPMPLTADAQRLGAAIRRLVGLGIFAEEQGSIVHSEAGKQVVASLIAPLSYCAVTFMGKTADGQLHIDYLAAIRTTTIFWIFRFQNIDDLCPKVLMRCDYALSFMNELTRHYGLYKAHYDSFMAEAAGQTPVNETICEKCHRTLSGDVQFCPKCGTPVRPATPHPAASLAGKNCPKCSAALAPDMQFCPKCGTSLKETAPPVIAIEATCSRCGAAIVPGGKFCKKCGAPAAGMTAAAPPPQQIFCVKCGNSITGDKKFCPKCGTPVTGKAPPKAVEKVCSRCAKVLPPQVKFCPKCGTPAGT
ncbi:MAG: zinc ribbon domain-containing protein [Candidatus Xenobiia bacterium LiM19]